MMKEKGYYEFSLPQLNGGINLREQPFKIEDNQSPDMLNVWFKDRILSSRWGQKLIRSLESDILSVSPMYKDAFIFNLPGKLLKWEEEDSVTEIATVSQNAGTFLLYGDFLYFIDEVNIYKIDSSFSVSAITPYIPTVYINAAPDFSTSDALDSYNLLGAGFKVTYNGDAATTIYKLPITGLDATTPQVLVNGESSTAFTYSALNGTVTFTSAPSAGTNNVEITAYKTVSGSKQKILNCKVFIAFGGESQSLGGGTRIFAMKNANFPYTIWRSGLGANQGPGITYFPDSAVENLDQNSEIITAAAKQGGSLIVFKERSVFSIGYEFDGADVYYPIKEINSSIGCDMPLSIQLIDNSLIFFNSLSGGYALISIDGSNENAIKPISGNINGGASSGLLDMDENDLKAATSVDFSRKYWLNVGSYAFLWDYDISPYYNYSDYEKAQHRLTWYRFDNIVGKPFFMSQNSLYCVNGKDITCFTERKSDFEAPIVKRWKSKAFDFGKSNYLKTIYKVYPSIRTDTNSNIQLSIIDETKNTVFNTQIESRVFSWEEFNWGDFAYNIFRFAKPIEIKSKLKKVIYLQIDIRNDKLYRDIGISDIIINYYINSTIRR